MSSNWICSLQLVICSCFCRMLLIQTSVVLELHGVFFIGHQLGIYGTTHLNFVVQMSKLYLDLTLYWIDAKIRVVVITLLLSSKSLPIHAVVYDVESRKKLFDHAIFLHISLLVMLIWSFKVYFTATMAGDLFCFKERRITKKNPACHVHEMLLCSAMLAPGQHQNVCHSISCPAVSPPCQN